MHRGRVRRRLGRTLGIRLRLHGTVRPLNNAIQDWPDLFQAGRDGFTEDYLNANSDYYDYKTATEIEDGIDEAAYLVAG